MREANKSLKHKDPLKTSLEIPLEVEKQGLYLASTFDPISILLYSSVICGNMILHQQIWFMLKVQTDLWKTEYWTSRLCAALQLGNKTLFSSCLKEIQDDTRVPSHERVIGDFTQKHYPFQSGLEAQNRRSFLCSFVSSGEITISDRLLLDAFYHSDSQLIKSVEDFLKKNDRMYTETRKLADLLYCVNHGEIQLAQTLLQESTQESIEEYEEETDEDDD